MEYFFGMKVIVYQMEKTILILMQKSVLIQLISFYLNIQKIL